MPSQEEAAQAELRELTQELSPLLHWLREIVVNLPAPAPATGPREGDPDGKPDVATEIRATCECVLADYLEPALRDLDAASRYRPLVRRELGRRPEA
jgi:hypothetical protein